MITQAHPTQEFLSDARKRMVDSQLRPNKISDPRLIDAMRHLPRERFLPAGRTALAYADDNIPLGDGRVLMQPMVLARLAQASVPLGGETILVVGAGTGYSAALFAALGCVVTALEAPGPLADHAMTTLAAVAPGVRVVTGPLEAGWTAGAPYDIILIDGAVPEIPPAISDLLNNVTGRLITILDGGDRTGRAIRAEPTGAGLSVIALFDARCAMLPAFALKPGFAF